MKSTLNSPILFFEDFLTEENLKLHEENFYKDIINPSQQSFDEYKEGGYITYTPSIYENDEDSSKTVFYKDTLISILENEKKNSIDLINSKILEIKNSGNSTDYYVQSNLNKLFSLKRKNLSTYKFKKLVLKIIDEIINVISANNSKHQKAKRNNFKISEGFFEPNISALKIKKIYQIAVKLNIIKLDIVSEETFLNVLICENPSELDEKIYFSETTLYSFLFLNTISKHFNNFRPSSISKSGLFYTKKSTQINQGLFDTYNTRLKSKIDTKRYKEIIEAFSAI
ncbi:MAG: hypothetical protein IE891_04210 [Flavobacteriaceae bacterium]|nr:hypothetical protein [Flavobacteriaceae bacterium]